MALTPDQWRDKERQHRRQAANYKATAKLYDNMANTEEIAANACKLNAEHAVQKEPRCGACGALRIFQAE